MKTVGLLLFVFLTFSCSKSINYSPEFIKQTSGRYLYGPDEVLKVYYENNKLYLSWRKVKKISPVILDKNTFFVADMYKKLRFVQNKNTKQYYLSVVNPENEDIITYDYMKLPDSVYTPSEYLAKENFDKALEGFMSINKQDSTSYITDEGDLNRLGYGYLREKEYQKAIEVFKINVALNPESSNVFDSLADAYLRSGDSLQAFNNYKKALEMNPGNSRANKYIKAYQQDN